MSIIFLQYAIKGLEPSSVYLFLHVYVYKTNVTCLQNKLFILENYSLQAMYIYHLNHFEEI